MVLCESPKFWKDRTDIITNPLVVIEVLSRSTENYDRGKKFHKYRALPSFREYILVAQDKVEVEAWSMQDDMAWAIQTLTSLEEKLHIPSLGIQVPVEDIYYQIEL